MLGASSAGVDADRYFNIEHLLRSKNMSVLIGALIIKNSEKLALRSYLSERSKYTSDYF